MANEEHLEQLKQGKEGWNRWRSENKEIRPDLRDADLSGANLREANLVGGRLSGANLIGANLIGANLRRANLREANLNGAILAKTTIARTDLRTIKGLTTIHHWGPSYIELFSVQLPQDGSALHFLRGAGVPDEWIEDYCKLDRSVSQFCDSCMS